MFNRSYIYSHKGHPHYIDDLKLLRIKKSTYHDADLSNVIRNLSDPTKLKIYEVLKNVEEISVKDMSFILGISQSAISHALSDLKNIGLVKSQRCGKLVCYSLTQKKNRIEQFLNKFI